MTPQEIFDTVVAHLFAQKHRAFSNTRCVYRAGNGDKCAVGVLIPDDVYSPKMEGGNVEGLIDGRFKIPDFIYDNHELLGSLQGAHDNAGNWDSPLKLAMKLSGVAAHYGLSKTKLAPFLKPHLTWDSIK